MGGISSAGWIKLHRSLLEWRWASSANHFNVFVHLLLRANYRPAAWQNIQVRPGQLITGRKQLAALTGLSEAQIRLVLRDLAKTGEIAIQVASKFSIITISNWESYQDDSQQIASKSPADSQQIATNKEGKKNKKERKNTAPLALADNPDLEEVPTSSVEANAITALNTICGTSFRPVENNLKLVRARIREGFTLEEIKAVINLKFKEWGNDDRMRQYLRPSTIFGSNFEGYLQAAKIRPQTPEEFFKENEAKICEVDYLSGGIK